jgi:hypothetical protein
MQNGLVENEFLSWETFLFIDDQITLTLQVEVNLQTMLG